MLRIVFIFLLSFSAFSQEDSVLFLGNYQKVCVPSPFVHKSDSLPDNLKDYSMVFIYSGAHSFLDSNDIERIVLYVHQGGNIYIGGENWPLQAELNEVTNFLFQKTCYGNYDGVDAESAKNGRLELSALDRIPSGKSTTSLPLDPGINVEAWTNDQPLIVSAVMGKGKLVMDGGYSRFYCEFESEDTKKVWESIVRFFEEN